MASEALDPSLRCPFCGGRFNLHETVRHFGDDGRLDSGVIWCECCAFPVVAGIPVLKTDEACRAAMQALEDRRPDDALHALLGLDVARVQAFEDLDARGATATYREAIAVLSPDPEGTYFVYRFSDPTFVMAEGVLRALAQTPGTFAGRVLDLCGGSGHLTRVITTLGPAVDVVLADVFFWKLWLARRFTVPGVAAVCCDGNHPLPFAPLTFSTVVLSDAFPYIWHKRLLAGEMMRQSGDSGLIVMPHLHSSLGWNYSAGMTLTPRSYADLFAELQPRLFADDPLFNAAADGVAIDLSRPRTPEELGAENSFTLIASPNDALFRRYARPVLGEPTGHLVVNPLYRITSGAGTSRLTLVFPTQEYGDEFAACRRYLPDSLEVSGDVSAPVDPHAEGLDVEGLRRARVLIDAPPGYY